MKEFLEFARTLAVRSGDVIAPYFLATDLQVDRKADDSPVTRADREAEAVMRDMIRRAYPAHGVIGEEYGSQDAAAEFVWVLDPIDGTISFAHGCPLFGTLIGLLHGGQPVLGLVHNPILRQLCMGDGATTTLNDRPVRMRSTATLERALVLCTDVMNVEKHQSRERYDRLTRRTLLQRGWGDCYGYLLVASGGADIMLDPILNPWDVLPVIPVIRGAGGVITTWQGGDPATGNSAVAASKALHAQVIEILNA